MTDQEVPEFAIIGHPNEGKSSVVSTLSEDDTVRIGPFPGETTVCQTFPVVVDGKEIIRFVDTPGFQNPRQTLAWMQRYKGPGHGIVDAFIEAHKDHLDFMDECELLSPIARGAGIIYVVDGSRPLRKVDRIEMEILRLTARPRMAIINAKESDTQYLDAWKMEFRRQFNAIRQFNAHHATYAERLELLESLKRVDQDWQPALNIVIDVFKQEWDHRIEGTARIIMQLIEATLGLTLTGSIKKNKDAQKVRKELEEKHRSKIEAMEKKAHAGIKKCFKHNIFNLTLPPNSILHENLFSQDTWRFLGLKPGEVVLAAGVAGGAAGAALDVAAAGLTFGVFSTIGGLVGAGSAAISGRRMANLSFKGVKLGRDQIQVGPPSSIQFFYVLLDRALIYFASVINWAHGRRDGDQRGDPDMAGRLKKGYTAFWSARDKKICKTYFDVITQKKSKQREAAANALHSLLKNKLDQLSDR
ncbi:50S ribosome-binding GTPase [Desulfocicer vacuolatum DSM 3385]|uniref:50S ribosome-binding GTPase n=1 Tax=Desulfocicer vacuolatum DSM 3385 TaxID=1121400 RepID=A0A1W2AEZ0_9BACT|nr:GTPase/DUF3482 domain-containing protein [Desulfocicer vacuolatum]SMC59257.1 50S ribosome-binding GTPase [Desulfocicer vacuolatum DSM 3385]